MDRQRKNLTFEEWLRYVFDRPVPQDQAQAWYWQLDGDGWDELAEPALTVQFLTQAFENAALVFHPYSDAQLNQGLWYLASNACSSHMFALLDTAVPWLARRRCIASIHSLYEQCFARRCSPHLSHLDEPGANPLNLVCYMWWDILPIGGLPQDPARREMDQAMLEVMESTLWIDSLPCRESALHGLGHWQPQYPERVGEIIDEFSMSEPDVPQNLKAYMLNAYTGYVL